MTAVLLWKAVCREERVELTVKPTKESFVDDLEAVRVLIRAQSYVFSIAFRARKSGFTGGIRWNILEHLSLWCSRPLSPVDEHELCRILDSSCNFSRWNAISLSNENLRDVVLLIGTAAPQVFHHIAHRFSDRQIHFSALSSLPHSLHLLVMSRTYYFNTRYDMLCVSERDLMSFKPFRRNTYVLLALAYSVLNVTSPFQFEYSTYPAAPAVSEMPLDCLSCSSEIPSDGSGFVLEVDEIVCCSRNVSPALPIRGVELHLTEPSNASCVYLRPINDSHYPYPAQRRGRMKMLFDGGDRLDGVAWTASTAKMYIRIRC